MAIFGLLAAFVALGVALVLHWPAWLVFVAMMVAFNVGVVLLLSWFWLRACFRPSPKNQSIADIANDAGVQPGVNQTR
jgi:membrane protein implicated in regulation of membrane protease activity